MAQTKVTENYSIETDSNNFNMFISCHSDGSHHADVVWHTKTGDWNSNQGIDLDLKFQNFVNTSAKLVFDEAVKWIKDTFGSNTKICKKL